MLLCTGAAAQCNAKAAEELSSMLDSCRLMITYNYSDLGGKVLGNGTAVVQQNKYMVTEGNAIYICNGLTRWTMLNDTREIYIENAGGDDDIFGNLKALADKVQDLKFDGSNISFILTLPGFSDGIRCSARIDRQPVNPDAEFEIKEGVLKLPGWVVTDLR